jgi:hypothetical protein
LNIFIKGIQPFFLDHLITSSTHFGLQISENMDSADVRVLVDPPKNTVINNSRDVIILSEPETVRPDLYSSKFLEKTKYILLISITILVALIIYGRHNFDNDRKSYREILSLASVGDVSDAFIKMEENKSFSNPIINFIYQRWKKKMYARFVSKEEVFENTSGNKIVNDISNIYRDYWRVELMKPLPESRTDSTLYNNIIDYVISNKLTRLTKDSLRKNIKDDSILKEIIEKELDKTTLGGFVDQEKIRRIQDRIYNNRILSSLIPNFIYNILWTELEDEMNYSVENRINELR